MTAEDLAIIFAQWLMSEKLLEVNFRTMWNAFLRMKVEKHFPVFAQLPPDE